MPIYNKIIDDFVPLHREIDGLSSHIEKKETNIRG